ncbi:MAG: hypothetical protein ACFB0D_03570 [Phormidesmis sp.]
MPQPCSKPLSANPFESYRDPETGQWKVRYPASALPNPTQSLAQSSPQPVSESVKRAPNLRRWKKSSQTKVA